MNRKAMAILIISSLGFFIAILIFYSGIGSRQPGPDSPYLGHNAMHLFQVYYEAESRLLFLDNAAVIAWKNSGNDVKRFKLNLQPYLANFNFRYGTDLSVDDYEIIFKEGYLKARSSKELNISSKWSSYKFHPNFRVFVGTGFEQPSSGGQEENVNLISE